MSVSYSKLWKMLIDKKMSKADLRKAAGLAPNTMTKLRRDEEVELSAYGGGEWPLVRRSVAAVRPEWPP